MLIGPFSTFLPVTSLTWCLFRPSFFLIFLNSCIYWSRINSLVVFSRWFFFYFLWWSVWKCFVVIFLFWNVGKRFFHNRRLSLRIILSIHGHLILLSCNFMTRRILSMIMAFLIVSISLLLGCLMELLKVFYLLINVILFIIFIVSFSDVLEFSFNFRFFTNCFTFAIQFSFFRVWFFNTCFQFWWFWGNLKFVGNVLSDGWWLLF